MEYPTLYQLIRDLWIPILATIIFAVIASKPAARKAIIRAFFVNAEGDNPRQQTDAAEFTALKMEIEELKKKVDEPVTQEVTETIKKSLDAQLYSHIPALVQRHLERLSKDEDSVVAHLEQTAREATYKHLEKIPFTDLIESEIYREARKLMRESSMKFSDLLDRQLSSANGTRTVMMNLFVLFNLLLLLFFVASPTQYSERSSLTILGVYVSLSAFIIYIYRASNARAATLLSIKEDDKKLHDVFMFLSQFKKGNTFSNNEVEIVKSLLINRFEREKSVDHPYEVVLKGITNSTVLMRGGKVASTKETK